MKRLFVLRHAKSSWNDPGLPDFERPLNKRGKKAAPFMGNVMRERGYCPEIILSSPAERAKQTSMLFRESAGLEAEILYEPRIYGAGVNSLIDVLSNIDDGIAAPIIVGHNPGFEDLVQYLTGHYKRMPTTALAVVDLGIDSWSDLSRQSGNLIDILRPKEQKIK